MYVFIIIITSWGVDVAALFPELTLYCTVAECKPHVLVGVGVHGDVGVAPQTSLVVVVVVGWYWVE